MTIFLTILAFLFLYLVFNPRISNLEKEVDRLSQILEGAVKVPKEIENISASKPVDSAAVYEPTNSISSPVVDVVVENDETKWGQILAVLGVTGVFLGLAFFLKLAFDSGIIGITGRIILGYSAGVLAIILGMNLRSRYREYADNLTGGGIAILYLTTFAGYIFYHLFSDIGTYAILMTITLFACSISVFLESEALAALSFLGAFSSPFVMSLYKLEMVPLFTYLLILSAGNGLVAYWYKWSSLNIVGISGTFLTVMFWLGFGSLHDIDRVTGFVFVSLCSAVFLVSTMQHHVMRKEISDEVDGFALTLNAVLYAITGYILLHPLYPNSMGYFMLVLSIIYFIVAVISFETNKEDKIMNIFLPAISVLFLTVAIPLHFHGSAITVAWLTEALILFIIEYQAQGKNVYAYGSIVYVVSVVNLFVFHMEFTGNISTFNSVFNERFMLFFYAVIIGYAMAYIADLDSKRRQNENADSVKKVLAALAELLGLIAISFEISTSYDKSEKLLGSGIYLESAKNTAISVAWVTYATLLTAIGFAGKYRTLRFGGLILFFITAGKIFMDLWQYGPFYRIVASIVFGVLALIASFAYSKFKDRLLV